MYNILFLKLHSLTQIWKQPGTIYLKAAGFLFKTVLMPPLTSEIHAKIFLGQVGE